MPSASNELREKMVARFGDIDAEGPCKFLKDAGYALTAHSGWLAPRHVQDFGDMTREEKECLVFLIDEWDFDGLIVDTPKAY